MQVLCCCVYYIPRARAVLFSAQNCVYEKALQVPQDTVHAHADVCRLKARTRGKIFRIVQCLLRPITHVVECV